MTAAAAKTANNKPAFVVCEGNEAAAIGVGLSRPDVVAVYPITPQSSLVEHLSQMIADGRLRADLMNVEGEHAVLNGLQGVALAGGRTFTATCGPGIAFMFEPYVRTPGLRLPMVASLVTRDLLSPQCVWGGQQDAMVVREAGWIQMYCETVQEILDTTVMAYKIAEHRDVMLPVNVCHDGNYLSFGVTRVELPDQDAVDEFLGPPNINWHIALDPLRPMGVDPLTGGAGGTAKSGPTAQADNAIVAIIMASAVRNCVSLLQVPLEDALRFASRNPAEFIGVGDRLGKLDQGYRADMVSIDPQTISVLATWVAGQKQRPQ